MKTWRVVPVLFDRVVRCWLRVVRVVLGVWWRGIWWLGVGCGSVVLASRRGLGAPGAV